MINYVTLDSFMFVRTKSWLFCGQNNQDALVWSMHSGRWKVGVAPYASNSDSFGVFGIPPSLTVNYHWRVLEFIILLLN